MTRRARAIGAEAWEAERQMTELNASLARNERREEIAVALVTDRHVGDEDFVVDDGPAVESVDGGYWVAVREWVDADTVEDKLKEEEV